MVAYRRRRARRRHLREAFAEPRAVQTPRFKIGLNLARNRVLRRCRHRRMLSSFAFQLISQHVATLHAIPDSINSSQVLIVLINYHIIYYYYFFKWQRWMPFQIQSINQFNQVLINFVIID